MKLHRQGTIVVMDINGRVHAEILCSSKIGQKTKKNPFPQAKFPMKKIAKFLDSFLKRFCPEYRSAAREDSWEDFIRCVTSASLGSEVYFVIDPKFQNGTSWSWELCEDKLDANRACVFGSALEMLKEELGIVPIIYPETNEFANGLHSCNYQGSTLTSRP